MSLREVSDEQMIDNQFTHQRDLLEHILTKISTHDTHILTICTHIIEDLINYRLICSLSREDTLWHLWHTRIHTLLQTKTPEKRWFGICLAKISAKQNPESLFYHGITWCQLLLNFLVDDACTIVVYRSCLTLLWIFIFSHEKPAYMRLFVTSFLGTFLNSLIKIPIQHPSITRVCIDCIKTIIMFYPTMCRPFISNIKIMITQAINETHINQPEIQETLFSISSKLHLCKKKELGPDEWKNGVLSCLWVLHKTIDHFFHDSIQDPYKSLKLPEWEVDTLSDNFYEAFETSLQRFKKYVRIIQLHLNQCTPYYVKIPAGQLFFFTYRVFRISDESNLALTLDNKEKSLLFTKIPYIHLITSKLLMDMIQTLGSNILLHLSNLIAQLNYIFSREKKLMPLKISIYNIFNMIFHRVGSSFSSYKSIEMIIQEALNDLNQLLITSQSIPALKHKNESKKKKHHDDPDIILDNSKLQKVPPENVIKSALNLISSVLSYLPPGTLSTTQRSLIDKTIISIALLPNLRKKLEKQIYDSLINNILSPGDVQAIILPHVIRIFETNTEVDILASSMKNHDYTKILTLDAILHPRFPPLQRKLQDRALETDYSESKTLQETNKIYLRHLKYENTSNILDTTSLSNIPDIYHTLNTCNTQETSYEKHSSDTSQDTITSNITSQSEKIKDFLNEQDFILENKIQNDHILKDTYQLSTEDIEENNVKNTILENMETDESDSLSNAEIPAIVMENSSSEE
ncbi:hypothetical protein PCANB_001087 [Pneumocystis canis]|nr:hypothetical protein PCK1_001068 [Pneumocystis canis]KAG5437294.1 hypothetical protein PCANB_001087 [Pneumocystis canis]